MDNPTIFSAENFLNKVTVMYDWPSQWPEIFINNGAIIAGGSVLAGINTNTPFNDIDTYVNLRNAQKFCVDFKKKCQSSKVSDKHIAPAYDQSFLIKNNILGRLAFQTTTYPLFATGDIMIVSDDVTLESVVENFDLSFCKVWFDGRNILTNYPVDINQKNGMLGVDYLKNLLSGNLFTIKRIKKYTSRGYTVKLPNIKTKGITITKPIKKVISPSMWVVSKLIERLLATYNFYYTGYRYQDLNQNFSIMIFFLQKLNDFKLDRNVDTIYNIDVFKDLLRFLYPEESLIGHFYDINKFIYLLLINDGACQWYSPKYVEYFRDIGIQLYNKNSIPAHGFDNEDVPLCDGEVPPFSSGKSGIPINTSKLELEEIKDEGDILLEAVPRNNLMEILYNFYPALRPESAAQRMARIQEENRVAAQRFAVLNEDEDEDEATEPYGLPNNQQVSGRCFSIMDGDYINTSSWYPKEDSILLLVEFDDATEPVLVCTNMQIFNHALNDESRINYKCASKVGYIAGTGQQIDLTNPENIPSGVAIDVPMRDIDFNNEYIPFAYGFDGTTVMNGYITRNEVNWMMESFLGGMGTKLFTLKFKDTITHTVSKNNTGRGTQPRDFVGTNHCQSGSAIMVFEVNEYIGNHVNIEDVDEL